MTALRVLGGLAALGLAAADPLACQPNEEQPMLPLYHIIGNVTKNSDGSIKLEPINDCSGVTYAQGIYHVWHQCCQNHWFAQCLPLRRRLQPDCSRTCPAVRWLALRPAIVIRR